ncbi:unnamed protein product, partial [Rotaria magnacalcarata]
RGFGRGGKTIVGKERPIGLAVACV